MRQWIAFTALAFLSAGPSFTEAADLWTDTDSTRILARGERDIVPSAYRTLRLDLPGLNALLSQAPLAGSPNAEIHPSILRLPLPDGSFGRFQIEEAPIMAPELAAKYPQLKTYRGQGIDDPTATLRFDTTPQGFHAMVLTASDSFWIDPFQRGDTEHYIVYRERELYGSREHAFTCGVTAEPRAGKTLAGAPQATDSLAVGTPPSNGGTLRDYRIAVAATGEYTAFHSAGSPTVAEGLAAVVTAMNRVNGIYERSLSMTLTLVANNDLIIYTNGATDPYPNGDVVFMMFDNETNLNAVIGSANFDIGHVFGTGGGGVAIRLVPCTPEKARGASAGSPPVGDSFWVRTVAHEIGHQFGANHTFNGDSGACGGNNQLNPGTAYEPGSGSTIMSYAGLCGSQNLQGTADTYYHSISLQEIADYTVNGDGNSCPTESATGNGIPTVEAGPGHTIPINTPFELCGSAADPDGHPLTFAWEQFNLGPTGDPNNPLMDAPIFRSWPPTDSLCRTFPRLENLLAGTSVIGELLPSYARTLTFRLTARDNQAVGGAFATDEVDIEVTDQAGPFLVTTPGDETWMSGQTENVTWDVAGTQLAPINCSAVDILLSEDGGLTYPHVLADNTANDGTQPISVPLVVTLEARVKVLCSDNIFFDVSDQDFVIEFSDNIFSDGFESGDTSAWSSTSP